MIILYLRVYKKQTFEFKSLINNLPFSIYQRNYLTSICLRYLSTTFISSLYLQQLQQTILAFEQHKIFTLCNQIMNLKEHNNIVQKLIEQIDLKDKQIAQLNKQISLQNKTINQTSTKTQDSTQTQKIIQKRIAQLNKQHQSKLSQLNQQIKTLTQENNDLKQRLTLKTQLQNKERERIAEVLKKNVDRKPGSKEDYKISALISHYQGEINKKNTFIETLRRQLKSMNSQSQSEGLANFNKSPQSNKDIAEEDSIDCHMQQIKSTKKSVSVTEHNKATEKLIKQIQSLKSMLESRNKEIQQLKNNYNDLTKEYYRIVNDYGPAKELTLTTKSNSRTINEKPFNNNRSFNKNSNIKEANKGQSLQQSVLSQRETNFSLDLTEDLSNADGDVSVSLTFQQNFKKFNNRPRLLLQQQEQPLFQNQLQTPQQTLSAQNTNPNLYKKSKQQSKEQLQLQFLMAQILQTLNLSQRQQIVPFLNDLMLKNGFIKNNQQIVQSMQQFFYKFGMGKVLKKDICQILTVFEEKCNNWIQESELLDEVCIQLGAKRHKLIDKINSFKSLQEQYMQKMKSAAFLSQLNRSEKVMEFIDFFQLDKSDLSLPEQLRNIYQQLKYVDRFVKLVNTTLHVQIKDRKGLQDTLELVLKKLQKYHEWEIQIQKENQRKVSRKKENQMLNKANLDY